MRHIHTIKSTAKNGKVLLAAISKKSFARKIAAMTCAMALIASLGVASAGFASADTPPDNGTGTVNGNVEIDGTLKPLVMSITHPAVVNYVVDPNSNPTFTADTIPVTNNTKDAVTVAVQSLAATDGGSLTFNDVTPDKYTDWDHLTLAQSKSDIALGVGITNKTGWDKDYNTTTDYASLKSPETFGNLQSGATGSLSMTANHGLAFDKTYTAKHSLVFNFNLV